jgi:uncharacterized protein YoxC
MSIVGLILDVSIIALLVATIAFAVRLNRQLTTLRDSKAELEALVRGFAEATERAETGVESMKKLAQESGERLQKTVERAQAIRDELQFMVETADSLAGRLEGAISGQRAAGPARPAAPLTATRPEAPRQAAPAPSQAAPAAAAPAAPGGGAEARSRAERELLQALENLR